MAKVRHHSTWDGHDTLDGKRLHKRDRIEVTWPDGTTSTHSVAIDEREMHVSDHGMPGTYRDDHAYVIIDHRGKRVRCYLTGMEARRVAQKETT